MGMHWGNLGVKVRGIIYYSLSPYEQRAFAGFLSKGLPNSLRRFITQAPIVLPPFIGTYALYNWAENKHIELSRKNPKDYENDV